MIESKQLEVLNRLFASTDKPEGMRALDVSFTARLILRKADESPVRVADGTWALELGCGETAFRQTVSRVETSESGFGWVQVVRGQRKGQPSSYTLLIDKLPLSAGLKRTILTDEIREFTKLFMRQLRAINPKRKFYRNTDQRWSFRFQQFLNRLDGDMPKLTSIVQFALSDATFRGPVIQHGPKAMRKFWRRLLKAHQEHTQKLEEAKPLQELRAQHDAEADALFAENV